VPPGFEVIEPTLEALDNEMRERVNESHEGYRKNESLWPVHQINWQRTRYVYDMYYKYGRISREVYDYCVRNRIIDSALAAKWKKPGYERLCSTYVINTLNYKFGTVSICRVPNFKLPPGTIVEDVTTGCRGCASGRGGMRNIFGNKYGQYLADIQVARELAMEKLLEEEDEDDALPPGMSGPPPPDDEDEGEKNDAEEADGGGDDNDDDDDDDDDDDYGPAPKAKDSGGAKATADDGPAGATREEAIPKASGFEVEAKASAMEADEREAAKNKIWAKDDVEEAKLKDALVRAEYLEQEEEEEADRESGQNKKETEAALRALVRGGQEAFEAKDSQPGSARKRHRPN